jgi:hypothetical protein
MIENILEIAKRNGADVGTWDKSGNGVNLVSFKTDELQAFVSDINQQLLTERNECVEEIKKLQEALRLVLPLAKGYAGISRVNSNYKYCGIAEEALSTTDSIQKLIE